MLKYLIQVYVQIQFYRHSVKLSRSNIRFKIANYLANVLLPLRIPNSFLPQKVNKFEFPAILSLIITFRLIHITDWLPTLLSAAGSDFNLPPIDGLNQWKALIRNENGPRKEMLYNIDPGKSGSDFKNAAIRYNDMKLIIGDPGKPDGWIPPPKVMDLTLDQIQDFHNHFFTSESTCSENLRLYNLTNDPLEKHNLAKAFPDIVLNLKSRYV